MVCGYFLIGLTVYLLVLPHILWLLQIKRPYFHVKPLEKAQLKNWKEYLEFEIENGTHERVVVLFERCVISCALYEDFWIKVREVVCHWSHGIHWPSD